MDEINFTGKSVRRLFFLIGFILLFILVARIFYPFLTVLVWSGLLYIILLPLYKKVEKRRDGRDRHPIIQTIIAGVFALGGALFIIVPLAFLFSQILKQVLEILNWLRVSASHGVSPITFTTAEGIGKIVYDLTAGFVDLSTIDIPKMLLRFVQDNKVFYYSSLIIKNTALAILGMAFIVFTLFFFLIDGKQLFKIIVNVIPIEREHTRLFIDKMKVTAQQLVVGYFLVALYQAVASFILFTIFGVKGALVLASITLIAAFVPMVGTALVWLPVSIVRIFEPGHMSNGILLFILSLFFISIMDNFFKPFLLQDRLKMHPLLIFFAILGGLEFFGFNGIILGPLILILFFTALLLYDQEYERLEHHDQLAKNDDKE